MRTHGTLDRSSTPDWMAAIIAAGLLALLAVPITTGGCASDEPVGRSSTTTKRTTETPSEKTTVTETRKKETTVQPH